MLQPVSVGSARLVMISKRRPPILIGRKTPTRQPSFRDKRLEKGQSQGILQNTRHQIWQGSLIRSIIFTAKETGENPLRFVVEEVVFR